MARALVFPGQGAQYVGMGMALAERHPVARGILDQADEALGFGLSDIIAHGPEADLTRTDISQPAILTVSWMAFCVARDSVQPLHFEATAGLSLGEYTALVAAGAIDFATALRLVRLRGEAMQAAAEARAGGMVALIGVEAEQAEAFCTQVRQDGEVLQVANLTSVGQVVIAGDAAACTRACEAARGAGIRRALPLQVAGAFHTPHMQPAADRLAQALAEVRFEDPRVPVWSNVLAQPVTKGADIPDLLVRQLVSPVCWAQSLSAMYAVGIEEFWELGPGKTICGMVARTVPEARSANLDGPDDALELARRVVAGG